MSETIPSGILQEGIAIGVDQGIAIGVDQGIAIGMNQGRVEGRVEGEAKGIEIGEIRGEVKATLRFRFGKLSEDLVNRLSTIGDLTTLTRLFNLADTCATLDDFANAMK